ncbi:hypothetical protein ACJRO7_020939 [Eucalyptus globulus]|uniref:Uncharacterized protein n=1 Tax=Eucalyptus globulus TaxID=34317 RepID=A0ABD3KIA1_EUCGL
MGKGRAAAKRKREAPTVLLLRWTFLRFLLPAPPRPRRCARIAAPPPPPRAASPVARTDPRRPDAAPSPPLLAVVHLHLVLCLLDTADSILPTIRGRRRCNNPLLPSCSRRVPNAAAAVVPCLRSRILQIEASSDACNSPTAAAVSRLPELRTPLLLQPSACSSPHHHSTFIRLLQQPAPDASNPHHLHAGRSASPPNAYPHSRASARCHHCSNRCSSPPERSRRCYPRRCLSVRPRCLELTDSTPTCSLLRRVHQLSLLSCCA